MVLQTGHESTHRGKTKMSEIVRMPPGGVRPLTTVLNVQGKNDAVRHIQPKNLAPRGTQQLEAPLQGNALIAETTERTREADMKEGIWWLKKGNKALVETYIGLVPKC